MFFCSSHTFLRSFICFEGCMCQGSKEADTYIKDEKFARSSVCLVLVHICLPFVYAHMCYFSVRHCLFMLIELMLFGSKQPA